MLGERGGGERAVGGRGLWPITCNCVHGLWQQAWAEQESSSTLGTLSSFSPVRHPLSQRLKSQHALTLPFRRGSTPPSTSPPLLSLSQCPPPQSRPSSGLALAQPILCHVFAC